MKTLVLGLKICLRKISILFVKEYYSELLTAVCRAPFSRHPATGGRQIGKNGVCTCSNRRVGGCRLHASGESCSELLPSRYHTRG